MSNNAVDAVAELHALDAERGPASLQDTRRRLPRGARVFTMLLMLIACLMAAAAIWLAIRKGPPAESAQAGSIARVVESIKPPMPTPLPAPPPPSTFQAPATSIPTGDLDLSKLDLSGALPDMVKQRRLQSPLTGRQPGQQPASATEAPGQPTTTAAATSAPAFARRLEALDLPAAKARMLENRDMLITQGTSIDCSLQTRLITTQAGMLTCTTPVDVYSTSGRVKLIDAGSKFVGYQQSGFSQGQDRIFVVWSRMESPHGVIINLDSPGVGPLGESGIGGYVDHHFWDRFGNAILISMIGDLSAWAANRSSDSANTVRFDNTRDGATDAVSKVLEHSLDIPPTLYKNQGERIAIMVARDLDFSDVYDLKLVSQPFPPR